MSVITNIVNNMSEKDKEKLGRVGTKINTDGAHLLTIVEAYEIDNQRFYLKCEDAEGKTVDWTGFLKQKVGKDKDGVIKKEHRRTFCHPFIHLDPNDLPPDSSKTLSDKVGAVH